MVSSKEDVSPQDGWQWQSDGSSKFIQYSGNSITSVDIKMEKEDKCITLLLYFLDSWDNLIVAICTATQTTLKFDEIVASMLSKEMR